MKILKWIKKHWIPLAFLLVIVVFWGDKSCDEAGYRKDIAGLNEEIAEKAADNVVKDEIIAEAKEQALKAQAVVAEKEANIEASRLRIKELEEKETVVVEVVMALPPSRMVEEFREIPDCENVQPTEKGILFPVKCARAVLVKLERFDLVLAQLDETRFSLSESLEATQFQKIATWNVYRIAWAQGSQIMNYQTMLKLKDEKFLLCEKQRGKSFWRGLKLGLTIGVGVTVTFVIVLPAIKAIF